MNRSRTLIAVAVVLLAGLAWWKLRAPAPEAAATPTHQHEAAGSTDKQVLYWYDPMKPDVHFDKPGKSPFMDMDLQPKYAEEGADKGTVVIDARVLQNLGVRTTRVERGTLRQSVDTVGAVQPDEHRIVAVQARVSGWIEKLHVRAVNDAVRQGQLLAEVYSPDLLAAQEEYLLARKNHDDALTAAARSRLSLLGVSDRQLEELSRAGAAQRDVAIYAPASGVVTELGAREGAAVNPGMNLFQLVDLSKVWVNAEIPESQAGAVKTGGRATATVAALPGHTFTGQLDYVVPQVMAETRTAMARIVLDNPRLELKPGMYAAVTLASGGERTALLVPSEAVIRTGTRSVAIVVEGEGRFRPVEVVTGVEGNGKTEVRSGLEEGQQVVASGQFLIDSEASLRGALERFGEAPPPTAHQHGSAGTPEPRQ